MAPKSDFLKKLREANKKRGEEWCEYVDYKSFSKEELYRINEVLFRSNELQGESGELAEGVKKLVRVWLGMKNDGNIDKVYKNIKEEIGDVMICLDRIADFFGVDLEEVTTKKFNKTSKKHSLKERL